MKFNIFKKILNPLNENFFFHALIHKLCTIMSKDNVVIIFFLSFPPQRFLNPTNFSLHIAPTQISDSGDYSCIVNDKLPVDIVELVVHDVPEAPSRPMITSFTSRSVNLSWAQNQHPKNEPVTDFLLETR